MVKRILAFLLALSVAACFVGCTKPAAEQSSAEIIVEEETVIQGGESTVTNEIVTSSDTTQNNSSVDTPDTSVATPVTSVDNSTGSDSTSSTTDTPNTDYDWKNHSGDFKLLAFTFDDGPSSNMARFVQLFSYYEGAGTFFVNGTGISGNNEYVKMQNAINYGWAIGNHGDNHLVATIGGVGGSQATYDQIKADINDLTNKLESNLKNADGTQYKVNLYRPPNIKPTADTFKICGENNLAVIWLAQDALDWDSTKTYQDRYNVFKNGISEWKDGDIVLCHETQYETYQILEELLPQFYKAGYRFCSITELMELRGISLNSISGELNNEGGNGGMVTNILDAAKAGKK